MEFVQFHPTALYKTGAPRFLLSEALRGEGALLRNMKGERFMTEYDPRAELAARDIVARAIASEIGKAEQPEAVAFLDLRHLDAQKIAKRFPRIHSTCLQYGVDITRELVPVRPAAHYLMGGIKTDLCGKSSVAGLYAAGETACTGVHGANRLASNSLLEGLVFGARAGEVMRNELRQTNLSPEPIPVANAGRCTAEEGIGTIQNLMWRYAGVIRTGDSMRQTISVIDNLEERLPAPTSRRACEARNLQQIAWIILRSAISRKESRGAHFRTDFPEHNDAEFKKHSLLSRQSSVTFE